VMIFNSTMIFVRMSDEEVAALQRRVNGNQNESRPR